MKYFICAAFPSTEKYLYQTHWPPWHVIHNVFKQCTLHAELRTVGQNTRRGCLKAFGNTLFNHMSSQSRLLGPLARWALSVFEYADSTHPLDTCSHTVKPSGESSPTVKMVFQESRSFFCSTFCLLPTAWSLYTLVKRLSPSLEQTSEIQTRCTQRRNCFDASKFKVSNSNWK